MTQRQVLRSLGICRPERRPGITLIRRGLALKIRELLTSSMLASLGGCEPQLSGHVVANLAVGKGRRTLIGIATQWLPCVGYPRVLNALRVINEGTST